MTTHTNSGTHPCGKRMNFTLLPDPIINLPQRGTGLDHSNLVLDVDSDCGKFEQVDEDKGFFRDIGDALVIVTTAPGLDMNVDVPWTCDASKGVTMMDGFRVEEVLKRALRMWFWRTVGKEGLVWAKTMLESWVEEFVCCVRH
ncbi:hypothetical protein CR513_59188, partial [Mucuna pruriens]